MCCRIFALFLLCLALRAQAFWEILCGGRVSSVLVLWRVRHLRVATCGVHTASPLGLPLATGRCPVATTTTA
ncbi:hypothetical protein PF008_g31574 [Phytophthora fragariae]|uniref:Secreted protein n=1 Tax=Phytophthora fragariae TaxID=53985 RepID=A0A6G0Q2W1_9STRA|nr:hypothetical protein PF008_g31574 [Phytophthora fragariae]